MKDENKSNASRQDKLLEKYKRKLIGEAVLKSLIWGLIGGFLLSIPVSVVSLATSVNTLWIALLVVGVATAVLTVAAYFKFYYVDVRKTAVRVDGIGLEERVVTMVEYADRGDVIAERQRADAERTLQHVEPKQVKLSVGKTAIILLVVAAILAVFFMITATVNVTEAEEPTPVPQPVELTEEDKIIQEMLQDLRRIIAEANVKQDIKDLLNGMVDDLEASLSPQDSTAVKIAKISETSQKIHRILKEELSKTTIAQELQKHSTTRELGKAIESADDKKIEEAFQKMYDSIAPLVGQEKYDVLIQTAMDIFQSLDDATAKTEDALAQALEDLANAMLNAIPENPPIGGEEDRVNDEINKALEDAMQQAMDAVKEALEEQKEVEGTDQSLQDAMQDAMSQLGQDSSSDNGEEKPDDKGEESDDSGPAHPTDDGDIIYDAVIDGATPYMDVYEDYYQRMIDLLTSGRLTEEQRRIIENYFNILN